MALLQAAFDSGAADELFDAFLRDVFPNLLDIADLTGVFSGAAGALLSGALGVFNIATGYLDLQYDHKYEGEFDSGRIDR